MPSSEVSQLSDIDIYEYFGHMYAMRGDWYERSKRVSGASLNREEGRLSGQVQGAEPRPYTVTIRLKRAGDKIESVDCSCPMGGICKHSAALLFHAIRTGLVGSGMPNSQSMKADPVQPPKIIEQELPASLTNWIDRLSVALSETEQGDKAPKFDSILYLLDLAYDKSQLTLNLVHARKLKDGSWGKAQRADIERVSWKSALYVQDEDCEIARVFTGSKGSHSSFSRNHFPEVPELSKVLIERMVATERCFWKSPTVSPLNLGPAKSGQLRWHTLPDGRQVLKCTSNEADDLTVIAGCLWYINITAGQIGILNLPIPMKAIKSILAAPAIEPSEAALTAKALEKLSAIPKLHSEFVTETVLLKPTAKLKLSALQETSYWNRDFRYKREPVALVSFDYGQPFEKNGSDEVRTIEGNRLLIHKKDTQATQEYIKQLKSIGLFNSKLASSR